MRHQVREAESPGGALEEVPVADESRPLGGERPLVECLALAQVEPGAGPVLEEAVAEDPLPLEVEALAGSWKGEKSFFCYLLIGRGKTELTIDDFFTYPQYGLEQGLKDML